MKSKNVVQSVLVGRERESEELSRYLDLAMEGKGTTVFISAEAGIGKTRLMQEFLKSTKHEKDIVSLTGWCVPNAEVPYFPFIEAFNAYYSSLDKRGKEELEPNPLLQGLELTKQFQHLSPQAIKDQAFFGVVKILRLIATQKPIILLLEDIQWADSASLALIHYIARAFNGSEKVLFLATFRSEELTNDIEGYPHQLVETLAMMKREDIFSEIKLMGLNRSCVLTMMESMLGGSVQQNFAEKLFLKSEGNPLFVVECVRMLVEQGKIFQENNKWQFIGDEIEIPGKIRDIIMQRLACLNSLQRRILDAASIVGDEFKASLIGAIIDEDSLDVLETLTAVANLTSIVYIDEGRFRFDHALSREIVYWTIAKPLRQGYHNRLAEKLECSKSAMLPLSDLAYHYIQAKNKEKAIDYAFAAAQNELAKCSNIEAIKHFSYVLQNTTQDPKRLGTREKALEGLGDAFYAHSLFKKANRAFEQLADTGNSHVVKLRAFRKAAESAFQLADPHKMLEIIKKAEPYAAADPLENARILVCRSRSTALQMKPYIKDLESALTVFEEEHSLWDVAWTLMGIGNFHTGRGKDHQGLAEALRSIALFEELGDIYSLMESYFVAGYDFIRCLLYDEALNVYAKMIAIDDKTKMGDFIHLCYAYSWSGSLLYCYMGDLEKGLMYNLKALELSEKTDSLITKGVVYANLAGAYTLLGEINPAKEYLERLLKLPRYVFNFLPINGEFIKALVLAGEGKWQFFEEIYEKLVTSHVPGWSEAAERQYSWLLKKQGRLEDARIQYEKFQRIRKEAEKRFKHANIQASLMSRRQVIVDQEFEIRIDLVNVGKKPCKIIKILFAIPSEFKIVSLPDFCTLENGYLFLKKKVVDSFKVKNIKLNVKVMEANDYKILAEVIYMDDMGENKTSSLNSISIRAKDVSSHKKLTSIQSTKFGDWKFSSEAAEKAFKYLVTAFREDQRKQRIPADKRGWRTRTEIARNAQISQYSMYGRHASGGEATRELRLLDVIESKLFLGERSRAGRVLKMRIRYEKFKKFFDE